MRKESAIKLQQWWRRRFEEAKRRRAVRMFKETVRRAAKRRLRVAATNIQRIYRGMKGRYAFIWHKWNYHASKIQVRPCRPNHPSEPRCGLTANVCWCGAFAVHLAGSGHARGDAALPRVFQGRSCDQEGMACALRTRRAR